MIISRRSNRHSTPVLAVAAASEQQHRPGFSQTSFLKRPETLEQWRKRTDIDGSLRRALQIKQDNELL